MNRLLSSRSLSVQFLFLYVVFSVAMLVTARSPVTSYELSVYAETPLVFWLGSIPLLLYGTAIGLLRRDRFRWVGLCGAFLVISAIVLLPLIRGYYFYGPDDALLHLGSIRDVVGGQQDPSGFFYPALFVLAASVSFLADIPPRVALMSTALFFPFVWFVSVPLVVRELTPDRNAIAIALLCALLLAPLNPLNIVLQAHPSSHAIFFAPVVLYTFFRLTRTASHRDVACFGISFLALYFYHPQQALNFLLILLALIVIDRNRFHARFGQQGFRRIPVPILLAGGVTTSILLLSTQQFADVFGFVVRSLVAGSDAGGIEGRTGALGALDVNLPLLLFKSGLKNVALAIGGILALVVWWRYRRSDQVPLLIGSTIPVFGFIALFGAVGLFNQLVRYVAVLAALGTIIGAIGFTSYLDPPGRRSLRSLAIVLVLCVGLLAAVPVIHPDPYTERPNPHVPQSHHDAFETQFEYASSDGQFLRIRSAPFRYHYAIYGDRGGVDAELDEELEPVPDRFEGLGEEYDGQYYLPVTEYDKRTDAELYRGFRYSEEDFADLDRNPETVRVYDNDGAVFYTNSEY